ncbi:MAG: CotH kinase family protein, partial [Planctomycetaceae bacterium]|nr:CotH kinase family protein [Planctomycetaceae bacterium]
MKITFFTRHLPGTAVLAYSALAALTLPAVLAQPPQFGQGQGGFGGRGGGPGGGPGGPGGPGGGVTLELTEEFDADENGWLNRTERAAAREQAQAQSQSGRRGGPGGRGRGGNSGPAEPGRQVRADQVDHFPEADLYAVDTLRTLFFEFENEDWEKELEDFRRTDVEVPATLTVDGKTYENVGMRFRGASSYFMVPTGRKRSFNVSMDLADEDQRLYGFKTLNLLNSNGDPSFMSSVLYAEIANQYIPAPRANHVHVVINGESWGVYVNVQQFNKDFLKEHYESSKGTRWKVSGSPNADGGLRYLGEELEQYQQRYDMKSSDGKKAWAALVKLCQTLEETPLDQLEEALEPMLDVDGALKFLALDVALVNSDGYWTRASDYSLFLDKDKRFHVIPHDMNEAFESGGGGPGGPGGPGGFGPPGFGGFGGGPGVLRQPPYGPHQCNSVACPDDRLIEPLGAPKPN